MRLNVYASGSYTMHNTNITRIPLLCPTHTPNPPFFRSFVVFVICCTIGITFNIAFLFTAARDWSLIQNRHFLLLLGSRSVSSYLVIFFCYMVLLQLLSVIIAYIKSDSSIYFYDGAHRRVWLDGIQHGFCKMVGGGGSGESFCAFNYDMAVNDDDGVQAYTLDDYFRVSFFDFIVYIVSLLFVSLLWGKIIRDNNNFMRDEIVSTDQGRGKLGKGWRQRSVAMIL